VPATDPYLTALTSLKSTKPTPEVPVTGNCWAFLANQQRLGVASPKLVCIDIQPYGSTQAPERADILNIGGFSDAVFQVVASYLADDAARFVAEVEAIEV
jgi:hypothetical protein